MESNRRELVRHIDGRIMIGNLPLKSFIVVLLVGIAAIIILMPVYRKTQSPMIFVLGMVIVGSVYLTLSEINNKERGIDILRNVIRYKQEGEILFERGNKNNESINIRCTWNKIEKRTEESAADF